MWQSWQTFYLYRSWLIDTSFSIWFWAQSKKIPFCDTIVFFLFFSFFKLFSCFNRDWVQPFFNSVTKITFCVLIFYPFTIIGLVSLCFLFYYCMECMCQKCCEWCTIKKCPCCELFCKDLELQCCCAAKKTIFKIDENKNKIALASIKKK